MKQRQQRITQKYRYSIILLKQLVKTDFKLRYQNSVLGYLWSLLRPLAIFMIMYAIFVKVIHVNYGVPHSGVYLFLGLVLWNYFVEVTSGSVTSIVAKGDLIRKLNFPRYVIVFSGSIGALINLIINLFVVAIFMAIDRVAVGPSILLLPLFIAELFVFGLAIGFFLSALFVRFRDINYIWEVVMQAGFYATPILYPLAQVPQKHGIAKILMLNPLAQIMQDARHAVVTPKVPTITTIWGNQWARLIPLGITILVSIIAVKYFRNRSKYFAEEV